MQSISLGILGSTRGTALQAIIDAIKAKTLSAKINLIISNKKDALILEKGKTEKIRTIFLDPQGLSREQYEQQLTAHFKESAVELIVLIGYMRILTNSFIEQWRHQIINVHPSLLPDFAGGMDKAVHEAVLKSGVKETGCTVHYVDENLDGGPVLIQKKCPVHPDDTIDSLKTRVQSLEGRALVEAILKINNG